MKEENREIIFNMWIVGGMIVTMVLEVSALIILSQLVFVKEIRTAIPLVLFVLFLEIGGLYLFLKIRKFCNNFKYLDNLKNETMQSNM